MCATRRVEGRLRHADGERADAGPEQVEGVHRDPEALVRLAQEVVGGDRDAVEDQRADGVRREHVERLAGEPGAVGGDGEGGDAARAGAAGPGEDGVEVGLGRVGDPALLAGQPPAPVPSGLAPRAAAPPRRSPRPAR